MNLHIRALKREDHAPLNEMRRMDEVYEGILGLPSERLEISEKFFARLDVNSHMLVAEIEKNGKKKVVGTAGLICESAPRVRHTGIFGIMVHRDYQGQGIGRALMSAILDLADNWLMLVRIELYVFTDNERAISLYKSMGFGIEGTMRESAIKNGRYADEYIMGRVRLPG